MTKSAPASHFQPQPRHPHPTLVSRSLSELLTDNCSESFAPKLAALFSNLLLTTSGLCYGQASTVADSPAPLLLTSAGPTNGRLEAGGRPMGAQGTCDTARWFPAVPAFLAKRSLSPDRRPHRGHSGQQTARGGCPHLVSQSIISRSDQLAPALICESGAGGETDVELCVTLRLFTGAAPIHYSRSPTRNT